MEMAKIRGEEQIGGEVYDVHFEMAFTHSNGNIKKTADACIWSFHFFRLEEDGRRLDQG